MSESSSPIQLESSSEIEASASFTLQRRPNESDSVVSNDASTNTDAEFNAFMRAIDEEASTVIATPERYQPPTRKPFSVNKEQNRRIEQDFYKSCQTAKESFNVPSKTKLQMKIHSVTMTAKWKWLDKDDTCGICRSPYESCCSSCKMPGDDCPLGIAECRHAFHVHCISKWVQQQSKSNCPLCRFEWRNPPISIFDIHPDELLQQPGRNVNNVVENNNPLEENVTIQS